MEHTTMRARAVISQTLAVIALFSFSVTTTLHARSHSKKAPQNKPAFSYYMLVLSYAPDFCAQPIAVQDRSITAAV